MLIIQCSPILVPVFTTEPDTIMEPFPISTFPFILLFFEIIVAQLKFLKILFISSETFFLLKFVPIPIIPNVFLSTIFLRS